MQGTMATIAIKASPHISWKRHDARRHDRPRCIRGARCRLHGPPHARHRPAGSLMAAGKLAASDKVFVRRFDAPGPIPRSARRSPRRSGPTWRQSHAVRVVQTSAVVGRVGADAPADTARVDLAAAREIAQRTGAKARSRGQHRARGQAATSCRRD
jgi:hypothetical protein